MRPGLAFARVAVAGGLVAASLALPARAAPVGPTIYHVPVAFSAANTAIVIEARALCLTPCAGRVFYRTTVAGSAAELFSMTDPTWTSLTMGRATDATLAGETLYRFFVSLPASAADPRGVDYIVKVTDGSFVSWSPGTPAAPGVALNNGVRSSAHHVLVGAPTMVEHAPVPAAQYRRAIPIRADATCSQTCSATLYFRRTGAFSPSFFDFDDPPLNPAEGADVQWTSIAMSRALVAQVPTAGSQYTFTASIPAAYVDTRGVDYAIKVDDGVTRGWFPGTFYNGYLLPTDGIRIGWQHVHVINPVLAAHAQQQYLIARGTPLTVALQVACWAPSCSASVYYHSFSGPVQTLPMTRVSEILLPDLKIVTYSVTIPGSQVLVPTLGYYFRASDGHTSAYSPGTVYNGYYVKYEPDQSIRNTGEYIVSVQ